jgi:ribose 5-phosphate isomerase B
MKLAIGADDAGLELKTTLKAYAEGLGHEVVDYGVHDTSPCLYPDVANEVATAVAAGRHERGILICGTGIGMAIAANKVPGIRAALAHDAFSAERAVKSNDAQILTLGARVIGPELAKYLLRVYLESTFVDGPSTPKIQRIMEYERNYHGGAL